MIALSDDLSDDGRLINPDQLHDRLETIAQVVNGGLTADNIPAGTLFSVGNPGGGAIPFAWREKTSPLAMAQRVYSAGGGASGVPPPLLVAAEYVGSDIWICNAPGGASGPVQVRATDDTWPGGLQNWVTLLDAAAVAAAPVELVPGDPRRALVGFGGRYGVAWRASVRLAAPISVAAGYRPMINPPPGTAGEAMAVHHFRIPHEA